MDTAVSIILYALDIYALALIIRILSSWIPGAEDMPLMQYLANITEPVLSPVRRIIRPIAGIDFSAMVVLLLLGLVQELLRIYLLS